MYLPEEIGKILITEDEIKAKVKELGKALTAKLSDKNPLFLCVVKGSVVFFADLIREMECPIEIDFLKASSYGSGTSTSGKVRVDGLDRMGIEGRDVVLVEDIVDTALTLSTLKALIEQKNPASLTLVTLLDKPSRRIVKDFTPDYSLFEIDDLFVVGYGLDCAQKYRNLPYVGVVGSSSE